MKFGFSQQIFIKLLDIKFHGNLAGGNCVDTADRWTDRQTDMTEVTGAFPNCKLA